MPVASVSGRSFDVIVWRVVTCSPSDVHSSVRRPPETQNKVETDRKAQNDPITVIKFNSTATFSISLTPWREGL